MKKYLALLLLAITSFVHTTSEFRSPISLHRGHMHWPTIPVQSAWWYDKMDCKRDDCEWQWSSWAAWYSRTADKAFLDLEDKNDNTTDTVSLSSLYFGKEIFRGEEAFADGIIKDPTQLETNPLLGSARITPHFDYNEYGAYIGATIDRILGCDGQWHIGGRASIPFVVIETEQDSTQKLEETIEDLVKVRVINRSADAEAASAEFAIRLDYLQSRVSRDIIDGVNVTSPVIGFGPIGGTSVVTILGSRDSGTAADSENISAYVVKSATGEFPVPNFRKTPSQVASALAADGSGSNGTAYFFQDGINYQDGLFCDRDAMGTSFLVPRATDDGLNITAGEGITANALFTAIQETLLFEDINSLTSESVSEFFRVNGIELARYERKAAFGDAELEIYGGYGYRDHWFVDGVVGLRLPTGTRQKDAKRLFVQSTGHNKHLELKLGLEGGYRPFDWMALKADASYHHAFERTEHRAAPFKGATIRGIGTDVEVDVSWNYFIGHFDLNFFHPQNDEIGMVIGYEIYGKTDDNIDLKNGTTATDLFGRTNQELDATILEEYTNSMSHKIRGEVFHRWNLFEIFAGASQIFAGRSIMKETEAHFGFNIYF